MDLLPNTCLAVYQSLSVHWIRLSNVHLSFCLSVHPVKVFGQYTLTAFYFFHDLHKFVFLFIKSFSSVSYLLTAVHII